MPRNKGGLTTTGGWTKANFAIRPETKTALGHAALDRSQTTAETADHFLTMALSQQWVRLPVLGRVGAGSAVICEECVEDWVTLPASATAGAAFALRARGDSMAPTINDGDLVLVRLQPEAETGQIVVVRQDGEAVIKRQGGGNGEVELRSDNHAYPPIRLPRGEMIGRAVRVIKDL